MLFASSESEAKYSATCCSYPCDIMECVDCDRVNGDSDLQVELFGFLAVGTEGETALCFCDFELV